MDKIRVLQFPFSQNGGVVTYATNNWKYLNKQQFDCDFVVVRKSFNPAWEQHLLQSGAGVKKMFFSADREPERYIEQMSTILRGNYDVVHLHTASWKRFLIEQIAVDCKIPKIIVHSNSSGLDNIMDITARSAAEKVHYKLRSEFTSDLATDFCACSWAAADWLFGDQIPRSQIQILKNTIIIEEYIFNNDVRSQYRKKMGLNGYFVMGHAGRFTYSKNHTFLLEVFEKVCEKISNARLLLAGEGPLENDIKEIVLKRKLTDKVIFLGQRRDIPQLLQAMDVFCLPSRFEGLPLALIEAQTAGLKCVASDTISNEVCISDNIERIPFDAEKWVQAIIDVSKGYVRENMYDVITAAGYNIKLQIKEIEKLYSNFH